MASSRRRLAGAISAFADDLRGISQQVNDSIGLLKRTADYPPSAGGEAGTRGCLLEKSCLHSMH